MLLCFGADPNIIDKKVIKLINIFILFFLSFLLLVMQRTTFLLDSFHLFKHIQYGQSPKEIAENRGYVEIIEMFLSFEGQNIKGFFFFFFF